MTTATLPRRFMRPIATAPARRSVLIGFGATLVAGLVLLAAASIGIGLAVGSTVLGGVSVGGVDLGGLDRAAAAERLAARLPSLSSGNAVIEVAESEEVVAFADLGRGYETDAMLDAAFAIARSGNPLADGIGRLRSVAHATALPVIVHAYDSDALAAISTDIARRVSERPVEAAVTRDDLEFVVRASRDGRALASADVAAALGAAVDTPDPADVRIQLGTERVAPIVDTAEAEAAAAAAESMTTALVLTVPGADGEDELKIAASTIADAISFGPQGEQDYVARLDEEALTAAVDALRADVNRAPVDATISVAAAGGLGGVVAAQEGRDLDVEKSASALLAALRERATGASVASAALVVDVTEADLTTAEAEAIRPQMQLVSSWTTYYVSGEGNGFSANISIPARDLDGYNLAPGEWFSFWGGIGPISVERGYTYGGAIINGRSVAKGALAGGICSTSTTLFNAAMRFGLEIGERDNHFYYIDRYPTGLDATVAIVDDSVKDLTFRNDTDQPIVIRGFGSPGQVTFELWSVPTGRTVALSDPYVTDRRSAIETTQVDPSMAPGTARRVEYPHDGFNVTVSRTVYGPNGEVIHQNTWFSDYRPVNGITLVGPTPAAPPEPPDETP